MEKPLIAQEIFDRYLDGTANEEEIALLETWMLQFPLEGRQSLTAAQHRADVATVRAALVNKDHARVRTLWTRISVAVAATLTAVVTGHYLWKAPKLDSHKPVNHFEAILPASHGVSLTLANGQRIRLQYGHRGSISKLSKATQHDSVLTYQQQTATSTTEINTVTNNSGRKFSLRLADGTEVTLDVQSSLTYPVAFNGNSREVSATGQTYYKVKHDARQPFRVRSGGQQVDDIGTEFNVNAYNETRSTLVEGIIIVNTRTLKPGETASSLDGRTDISIANMEEVTAWMQDKMIFRRAKLELILAEVARVYGVSIVWQDDLRQREFMCAFNRKKPLADVLNYFRRSTNIDFKVENRTVTVFRKKN